MFDLPITYCQRDSEPPRFFFHVEAELFHGGPIIDREEDRIIIMNVLVIMPLPRSDGENIALMPFQALALYDDSSLAFKAEVKGCAVMAVR